MKIDRCSHRIVHARGCNDYGYNKYYILHTHQDWAYSNQRTNGSDSKSIKIKMNIIEKGNHYIDVIEYEGPQ